ncbi:MAG: 4-(cytidine 5'-diphospho)-2-C-methyl-D-erythritol kinase [Chloroflexi bacterium]|nr:4-(cytidine 5'-diphospho)-2-C-methyl-D-erythritol kinase [Chloroflexota bacterium]
MENGEARRESSKSMITARAPAKINLTLEVLGKRGDGYHEIRSIMQTIDLCDELSFEMSDELFIDCSDNDLPSPDNYVTRAAELLREFSGQRRGAIIRLHKVIPMSAGLGGGSSDAAATLVGLNKLWQTRASGDELSRLAQSIGSDVPFFIQGGTALAAGRGEIIAPLKKPAEGWILLLHPALPILEKKTARLYGALTPVAFSGGERTLNLQRRTENGMPVQDAGLYNAFDQVAEALFSGLKELRSNSEEIIARRLHLAGSGPALFAWYATKNEAEDGHRRLAGAGISAWLCHTPA